MLTREKIDEIKRNGHDEWKRDWRESVEGVKNPNDARTFTRGNYSRLVYLIGLLYGRSLAHVGRVKNLEARLAELESRPELKHCGTWEQGKLYRQCSLVTCAGGLWLAKRGNKQRPGASSAWQLVVKSGHAQ